MARYAASRWSRLAFGAAIFLAGVALLLTRPGIALAHHITATETGDCARWDTKAEYFGGTGDRKVVVDVMINAEHISTTFYFDLDAGHLGHQNYYLLYDRAGSGSLHTSGTVVMHDKVGGSYSHVVSSASLGMHLDCPLPASTATPTATATLAPPARTATSTAISVESSATPQPAQTPTPTVTGIITDETVTPLVTATSTPVTTSASAAPVSTSTVVTTGGVGTPLPPGTPTLVNIVRSSRRPGDSLGPAAPVYHALPDTGQGARTRPAILVGLVGTLIAAVGLVVSSSGMRARRLR